MTAPLTPEQARNWFSTIYTITERSTPITMVFLLITGGLFAYYSLKELGNARSRAFNAYHQLLLAKDEQLRQAMEFAGSLARVSLHCNIPIEEVLPKKKDTAPPNYFPQ